MKILLESRAFHPSIGGIEMMSHELARAWQDTGNEVQIVTNTPLSEADELAEMNVCRQPSLWELARLMDWADVFVQNGISLRSAPLAILTNTPLCIVHQTILKEGPGADRVRQIGKQWLTRLGYNIAISEPAARPIQGPVVHIPNTFRPIYDQPQRTEDERQGLLFVGRLVSVKGADIAIEALQNLRQEGIDTTLTICGDGPERDSLKDQVCRAGLKDCVSFKGWTGPEDLARYYRQSQVFIVPSRYEPFGIVALEAIASGCPVVAAQTGGLPEAVGDCGILVAPGDAQELADGIERALQPDVRKTLRSSMPAHVDRHRIDRIATDYLHLLRQVVREEA